MVFWIGFGGCIIAGLVISAMAITNKIPRMEWEDDQDW